MKESKNSIEKFVNILKRRLEAKIAIINDIDLQVAKSMGYQEKIDECYAQIECLKDTIQLIDETVKGIEISDKLTGMATSLTEMINLIKTKTDK